MKDNDHEQMLQLLLWNRVSFGFLDQVVQQDLAAASCGWAVSVLRVSSR